MSEGTPTWVTGSLITGGWLKLLAIFTPNDAAAWANQIANAIVVVGLAAVVVYTRVTDARRKRFIDDAVARREQADLDRKELSRRLGALERRQGMTPDPDVSFDGRSAV